MDIRVARMRDRIPGQLLMEKLVSDYGSRRPLTRLQQALGVSPIPADDISWHTGAVGEHIVGEALRKLPTAWRVFHSLPVGDKETDVDHVVVGPGGIFVLNTKHHPGKKIWVGNRTLLVAGRKTPHIPASEHEAAALTRVIQSRLPWAPSATPVIVVVGASDITIKTEPEKVKVRGVGSLVRWLRKRPEILSADAVDQLIEMLDDPRTWRAIEPIDRADLELRYAALEAGHRQARFVRLAWALGLVLAIVVVVSFVVPRIL